ncbi:hypothetical protein JCM8547_000284 [Rhodosporidiobolus lusitaniae]
MSTTTTTATTTYSRSVLGWRTAYPQATAVFPTLFPTIYRSSSWSRTTSAASLTHHHPVGATSSNSGGGIKQLVAVVVPILVGAILLLFALYALLRWQHKRARQREEETQRQAAKLRRARMAHGGMREHRPMGRREPVEFELKAVRSTEDMLNTLKYREDLARLERSHTYKSFDLPRKPPPAYEPSLVPLLSQFL